MAYADYAYYQNAFGGTTIPSEEAFSTLAERSSEYVDLVTFNRIGADTLRDLAVADAVERCTCAIAEAYYVYDATHSVDGTTTGVKTSESVGNYSVSWASPTDSLESLTGGNLPSYLRSLALRYLGTTGLTYRGVCY